MSRKASVRNAAAIVALVVAASGCQSSSHPANEARLEIAGGTVQHNIATSIPLTSTTATVSIGVARVCLSSAGTVSVTGIHVTDPGNMAVTHVGIRKTSATSEDLGTSYSTLAELDFDISPTLRLTETCTASSTASVDVGVELKRLTSAPGRTKNLAIDYASGKSHRTLQIPFTIVLCPTAATDKNPCIARPS